MSFLRCATAAAACSSWSALSASFSLMECVTSSSSESKVQRSSPSFVICAGASVDASGVRSMPLSDDGIVYFRSRSSSLSPWSRFVLFFGAAATCAVMSSSASSSRSGMKRISVGVLLSNADCADLRCLPEFDLLSSSALASPNMLLAAGLSPAPQPFTARLRRSLERDGFCAGFSAALSPAAPASFDAASSSPPRLRRRRGLSSPLANALSPASAFLPSDSLSAMAATPGLPTRCRCWFPGGLAARVQPGFSNRERDPRRTALRIRRLAILPVPVR
mmetsp:Transcript_11438/g.34743  ORF Transcript_11438/g.34743 Transcript_11438/m.34743 type:complete len:277 (+) Transcript_11438:137-967(+)